MGNSARRVTINTKRTRGVPILNGKSRDTISTISVLMNATTRLRHVKIRKALQSRRVALRSTLRQTIHNLNLRRRLRHLATNGHAPTVGLGTRELLLKRGRTISTGIGALGLSTRLNVSNNSRNNTGNLNRFLRQVTGRRRSARNRYRLITSSLNLSHQLKDQNLKQRRRKSGINNGILSTGKNSTLSVKRNTQSSNNRGVKQGTSTIGLSFLKRRSS